MKAYKVRASVRTATGQVARYEYASVKGGSLRTATGRAIEAIERDLRMRKVEGRSRFTLDLQAEEIGGGQ